MFDKYGGKIILIIILIACLTPLLSFAALKGILVPDGPIIGFNITALNEFYYKDQNYTSYILTHVNATGTPGPEGPMGPQGPAGVNGTQGIQGPQGPIGYNGTQGIQGIQGPQGNPGANGTNGTNGSNGYTWYSGSGAPSGSLGVNGDQYLNTVNGDVYLKSGGSWSIICNITGPQGTQGNPGTNGQGFTWRNAWVSGTNYVPYDVVTNAGSCYNNILATSGTTIPGNDPTHWSLVASKGDTGSPGSSFDVDYYRHYGTGTYEAWYTSPRAGTALAGSALTANRMYAMPFITPKAITIDRIGVYVSTLSTTTARLGIYTDGGNCYPGTLLLDAGTIDVTSTGAKTITISQVLSANTLYWLVIDCAATPAIYCIPVAGVISILGTSSGLGTAQNAGLYVSQTYGALPGTFPASPTMITAAPIPCIWVRLSG